MVLVEGGTVSMHNTHFMSMFSPDPAGIVQAQFPGSAVRLQNVSVEDVTAAHPFRVGATGAIYSNVEATVYDDTTAASLPALKIADIPDERVFLSTSDQWLLQLQEV